MNVGKLSLEWLDEMVSFSTDKYFANETVEDTLQKKRILKKTGEKTLKPRETSFDSTNLISFIPRNQNYNSWKRINHIKTSNKVFKASSAKFLLLYIQRKILKKNSFTFLHKTEERIKNLKFETEKALFEFLG